MIKTNNNKKPRVEVCRKMFEQGVGSLSDVELLALYYHRTPQGVSTLALAEAHLARAGSLHGWLDSPYERVKAWPGVGLTNYVTPRASLELARRYLAEALRLRPVQFDSLQALIAYLHLSYRGYHHEVVSAVYLDSRLGLLKLSELAQGGMRSAKLSPRRLLEEAIACHATNMILVHNHPSGDPRPSEADSVMTEELLHLLDKFELRLLDHIILGKGNYFSFAEAKLLTELDE